MCVTDTGIGVPDADQKDVFTRFFRASNATKRAIPGTGLGLAITQTIIAGHGGDMELQSREGKGTTVTVRLPLAGPVPPAGPVHQEAVHQEAAHQEAAHQEAADEAPTRKPPDTVPPPRPERGHEAPTRGRPGSGGPR